VVMTRDEVRRGHSGIPRCLPAHDKPDVRWRATPDGVPSPASAGSDLQAHQVLVRDGKGAKDRITMLPQSAVGPLGDHLKRARSLHQRDVKEGWGRVPCRML
jgi:hypothetical protein